MHDPKKPTGRGIGIAAGVTTSDADWCSQQRMEPNPADSPSPRPINDGVDAVVYSEAKIAVIKARALLPTLTPSGIGSPPGEFDLKEVVAAIAFLRQCRPTAKPKFGSYGLKHVAEHWARRYIANGSLIAAAVYLNLPMSEPIFGFPNVKIGVDGRDVARLHEWRRS